MSLKPEHKAPCLIKASHYRNAPCATNLTQVDDLPFICFRHEYELDVETPGTIQSSGSPVTNARRLPISLDEFSCVLFTKVLLAHRPAEPSPREMKSRSFGASIPLTTVLLPLHTRKTFAST